MIYWKRKADRTEKLLILAALLVFLGLILFGRYAEASDRGDSQTAVEYIYIGKDDNHAKYVIGGALLTCAVISIYKQRWCWEDRKPEPLPDPGPAVKNDITPDQPIGVRLY